MVANKFIYTFSFRILFFLLYGFTSTCIVVYNCVKCIAAALVLYPHAAECLKNKSLKDFRLSAKLSKNAVILPK